MNHLECAMPKRGRWYWYLLVLGVSFLAGNTIGAIPMILVVMLWAVSSGDTAGAFEALSKGDMSGATGNDGNVYLAVMMFCFAVILFVMIGMVKGVHGKTWTQVVNGTRRVRWSRVAVGFGVWAAMQALLLAVSLAVDPEGYEFRFDGSSFVWLVIISLTLIPLQTTCEEFAFRGYLAQGIAAWTKSRWAVLITTSLVFGLMHGSNPEIDEYGYGIVMAQYILMGFMLGLVTVLDDGIELAMGIHAANNILASVLVTFKGSVLPTAALFMAKDIDPVADLATLLVFGAVAVALFARIYKWRFGVLNRRVEFGREAAANGGE